MALVLVFQGACVSMLERLVLFWGRTEVVVGKPVVEGNGHEGLTAADEVFLGQTVEGVFCEDQN